MRSGIFTTHDDCGKAHWTCSWISTNQIGHSKMKQNFCLFRLHFGEILHRHRHVTRHGISYRTNHSCRRCLNNIQLTIHKHAANYNERLRANEHDTDNLWCAKKATKNLRSPVILFDSDQNHRTNDVWVVNRTRSVAICWNKFYFRQPTILCLWHTFTMIQLHHGALSLPSRL